jgi:hypothetical protein
LIVLTIVVVSFLILVFFFSELRIKLNNEYSIFTLVHLLHTLVTGIFIWFIWKKMPYDQYTKNNNILLVLFLGVIGMWIWLPNKNERNKLVDLERRKIPHQKNLN